MGKHKSKSSKNKNIAKEVKDGATSEDVERWLSKGRGSVTDTTKTGLTPLMIACQAGSRSVVKILLENQNGAITAQDGLGNSALHHLTDKQKKFGKKIKILLELLSNQGGRRMVGVPNAQGKTPFRALFSFVSVARTTALGNIDEVRRADGVENILKLLDPVKGGSLPTFDSVVESNANSAWQNKLGNAFEDDFQDYAGREIYTDLDEDRDIYSGASFNVPSTSDVHMTEEQHRKSIVDGIAQRRDGKREKKRNAKDLIGPARPSAAEAEQPYDAKRKRLADEMKAREQMEKEKKRKLAEITKAEAEEKRKEQISTTYETAATEFFEKNKNTTSERVPASYAQIPFPDKYGTISDVLLGIITETDAKRKKILHELRRWHPDRWTGQMDSLVKAEDQDQVLLRVIEVSKHLNSIMPQKK